MRNVIEKGRAVFLSPYTNLNIVLGLYIARNLVFSKSTIYIYSEYPIPPSLLSTIEQDIGSYVRFLDSLGGLIQNSILIAILSYADAEIYNLIASSTSNFYIFVHRFIMPKLRDRHRLNIYKVKKVEENTYSIQFDRHRYLIKVSEGSIEEVEIPSEVMLVNKELKELTAMFGSVKASDFLRYFSRKYGYSRDRCLELIRKAEALGLVKYVSGYLLAE